MRCPSCGAENPEDARFCMQCRTPLTAGATAATGSAPGPIPGPIPGGSGPGFAAGAPPSRSIFSSRAVIGAGLAGLLLCCCVSIVLVGVVLVPALATRTEPTGGPQPVVQPVTGAPTPVVQPVTQPVTKPTTTAPSATGAGVSIVFAKDISSDGKPVGVTSTFATTDKQIIQFTSWPAGRITAGTTIAIEWYASGQKVVEVGFTVKPEEADYTGHVYTVGAPQGGFPAAQVESQVLINGARAATASFTIR